MPLPSFKIKQGEAKSFPPVPDDIYQVELLDISVKQKPSYNDKSVLEDLLSFQFTILDEGHRGRNIWRDYVPLELYVSRKKGKNLLYQIIEAIIMRPLKPEEVEAMDSDFLNRLIGYQCRVIVKTKKGDDGDYNYIESFLPKKESMTKLTDDEKEEARVKVKQGKPVEDSVLAGAAAPQRTQDDDIPTINLDDEEPDTMSEITADLKDDGEDIKIEDVPF